MSPSKLDREMNRREIRSAVCGMLLGDSTVQQRPRGARMQIVHHPKSLDYLLFKKDILDQIPGVRSNYAHVVHNNRKMNKLYPQVRLWTTGAKYWTKVKSVFYNPKKRITLGLLNSLTPLGLAIWYMDDGHLSIVHNKIRSIPDKSRTTAERSKRARNIILCTHCFTKEENELMARWFKSIWNIDVRVKFSRGYHLYMNTENARKFIDIVRPYVLDVPSMHYKIDLKYDFNSPSNHLPKDFLRFNIGYWTTEKGHERVAPVHFAG